MKSSFTFLEQLKLIVTHTPTRVKLYYVFGFSAGFGLVWFRKWLAGGVCNCPTRIDGKTVVITGANTGIGFETALELAKRGGNIVIACRDMVKGDEARKKVVEITGVPDDKIRLVHLDLASLDSVRKAAKTILESEASIHYLVNNAGLACTPKSKTSDGFEMQIGVNHFGHFLLTNLLLDRIKESTPARIINLSSIAHKPGKIVLEDLNFEKRKYNEYQAYFQSKLANILFTKQLAKKLKDTRVTVYSLHPGVVQTELGRHLSFFNGWLFYFFGLAFFKTANQGAQTTLYCVLEPSLGNESGLYYRDCKVEKPAPQALDEEMAEKLWLTSERLIKQTINKTK